MSKFQETKQKLREAVIEANTLRKLQNWLIDLNNKNLQVDTEVVLFYINETKDYLIKQYQERGNNNE